MSIVATSRFSARTKCWVTGCRVVQGDLTRIYLASFASISGFCVFDLGGFDGFSELEC